MATDDERREVARKLRRADAERLDRVYGNDLSHAPLTLGLVAEAAGLHYAPYEVTAVEVRNRLADLIDPDCEEDRYSVARTARPVDRDALLALADILGSIRETDCRGCRLEGAGCAECSSGVAHEAAHRIREALGVDA